VKIILIIIFLSLADVHIQFAPYNGKIINMVHQDGSYNFANSNKATENEKLISTIQTNIGTIKVIQIAGFIFRRISNFVNINDTINIGQPIGMIKLSSRVDIIFPKKNIKLLVKENDRLIGGITKIGRIS
jgi:phosphatidylserine decarboxylase